MSYTVEENEKCCRRMKEISREIHLSITSKKEDRLPLWHPLRLKVLQENFLWKFTLCIDLWRIIWMLCERLFCSLSGLQCLFKLYQDTPRFVEHNLKCRELTIVILINDINIIIDITIIIDLFSMKWSLLMISCFIPIYDKWWFTKKNFTWNWSFNSMFKESVLRRIWCDDG